MATPPSAPQPSRILQSSRREALRVAVMWLVAMTYTVGYCGLYGYQRSAEDLRYVLGFPDWVFWGIVTPWVACAIVGIWFAYRYMTDEDLESLMSPEEEQAARGDGDA